MRILHTADWHLGRSLHGESLEAAHALWFDHLVDVVRSENVDVVLVAGDIYDRAFPPISSIEQLDDALRRLLDHTRVIITPGNHDSATRLGFGAQHYRESLQIRSRVADVGTPVVIDDGAALVYALPYLDPEMVRRELTDEAGEPAERSHQAVVREAMRRVNADVAARRAQAGSRIPAIVMAHAFVTGGEASDSERDIRVGGVDSVSAGAFGTAADYVALGHLHRPQEVRRSGVAVTDLENADHEAHGGPLLRYSGSPVAFSFSERADRKSSTLLEISNGEVNVANVIEAPVYRGLAQLQGTLSEILFGPHDAAENCWVKVTVTDPVRPERMRERILERFPHAIVTMHTPTAPVTKLGGIRVTKESDPMSVIKNFVVEVRGTEADEREEIVIRTAYEAVLAEGRSA